MTVKLLSPQWRDTDHQMAIEWLGNLTKETCSSQCTTLGQNLFQPTKNCLAIILWIFYQEWMKRHQDQSLVDFATSSKPPHRGFCKWKWKLECPNDDLIKFNFNTWGRIFLNYYYWWSSGSRSIWDVLLQVYSLFFKITTPVVNKILTLHNLWNNQTKTLRLPHFDSIVYQVRLASWLASKPLHTPMDHWSFFSPFLAARLFLIRSTRWFNSFSSSWTARSYWSCIRLCWMRFD